MKKPTIIIFTGVDGTGKTTLKQYVEKATNYKYIVIDRFTDSIVYDRIYKRPDKIKEYYTLEKNMNKIANVLLVYLYCNKAELLDRLLEKEESEETISNIDKAMKLYNSYLDVTPFKVLKINTSRNKINACINKIIKEVEKYDN